MEVDLGVLATQRDVLERIIGGGPLADILDAFVRMIEGALPDVIASVLLIDADGNRLVHGAAPTLPDFYNNAIDGIEIGPNVGSCGTAAFRREQVIVEDVTTDPLWADYRDLASDADLRACWSTPVLAATGALLGTFAMYYRTPRRPTPTDLALIEVFVRLAAVAIERATTDERREAALASERRAREELAFVLDVTTRLASTLDYGAMLTELAQAAVPALADICLIDVVRDGEVVRAAAAGPRAEELLAFPPLKDSAHPAADALATGETRFVPTVTPEFLRRIARNDAHFALVSELGYESFISVPLRGRGTVFGALTLVSAGSSRRFDAEDVALAYELATRVAMVIDNGRLYESVVESERQLQIVVRAGTTLTSSLDLAEVMAELCGLIVPEVADVCEVWVRATDGRWHHEAAPRPTPATRATPDDTSPPPEDVAAAFTSGDPVKADGVGPSTVGRMMDPRLAPAGLHHAAIVPLLGRGDIIGAICIGTVPGGSPDADPSLLPIIIGRIALAVDNARLYQAEASVARALQQQLLPRSLPAIDGIQIAARYLPGGPGVDVGGDWYDVLPLDNGRVGFAIGDVMGRGVAAAGVMAELRNALRGFALQGLDPASAVGLLDRLIYADERGSLATVLYADFDPERAVLRFANAGHTPPLLIDSRGVSRWLDTPPGPPVGTSTPGEDNTVYTAAEVAIDPGSTVILYTDGLIERRGESLEAGLARLASVAEANHARRPEDLCDQLMRSLLDDEREPDDTALLVVRID